MGEQQAETFPVNLSRNNSGMSWGFRLQGGTDFNTPLSVQVVQPKSVAEQCGLRAGDGIIAINNTQTDTLTHEQAKMEIIRSCNDIQMTVIRGAVQIWKPKVTPMSDLKPTEMQQIQTATGDQMYTSQKTSLAKEKQDETCTIGNAYNRSAKPFMSGGFGVDVGGSQAPASPQYGSNIPQYGSPAFQQQQAPASPPQQYQPPPQQYQPPPQQPQQYQPPPQQPQQYQPPPQQPQQYQPPQQQHHQQPPQSPKKAVPNVVHAQFNTPIGLYSAGNIAKTYSQQTDGIEHSMSNLDVNQAPVGTRMTGTFQKLDESGPNYGTQFGSPGAGGPSGFRSVNAPKAGPAPPAQPKQESMHCNGCGNMVTGVFVRVKGLPYHEKCFTCNNCGLHLKQKGYFMIEGKLFCEVHARRAAEAPGDNYRSAGALYR